jgi:sulfane dehydrogenase subunit SoxC
MNAKEGGRRRFLRRGATVVGLAVAATGSTKGQAPGSDPPEGSRDNDAYGGRSPFVTSKRVQLRTPLHDSLGIITPSALHFVNTHFGTPTIDPRQHRLMIHGMVDRPLMFTLEELERLPSVSRICYIECANNGAEALSGARTVQLAQGRTSCSEWTGVLLSVLLREAGVQRGASWLLAESADAGKHSKSIPLEKALDDVLVAYGQNGEPVRPENGYPLRLVVPGEQGVANVKWLRRLKVVDQPYMAKFEAGGYSTIWPDGRARWFQFEAGPKSIITRPSGGQRLAGAGFHEITGLAWSGAGAVRKVEVSTNGGETWREAELQEPVLRMAHTRFRFPWTWDGAETVLQSRCTDERGNVQPTLEQMSEVLGVKMDFWRARTRFTRCHFIQPWKVERDGSIHNHFTSILDAVCDEAGSQCV